MKIAVLLGGIGFDSQQKTINGILDKALADNSDVYIFTCEGWQYRKRSGYEEGEYNIYSLPDFTQYDGVIINADTIHDLDTIQDFVEQIKFSGTPCVSISTYYPEFMYIEMENVSGMKAVLEHVIEQHSARNIYYISGPEDNNDAKERLDAYKQVLMAHHLGWDKEHIYYGDYQFESGKQAVYRFLREARTIPDAIAAANDEMAIGAMLALKELGYRVPEDIIVTGYDNSKLSGLSAPRLTTVQRGEYAAGVEAYEKIKKTMQGEEVARCTSIHGEPIYGGSCGCTCEKEIAESVLQEKYIVNQVDTHWNLEMLKSSAADFTGVTDYNNLMQNLEKFMRVIDLDYFYLCMCGSIDEYYEEMNWLAEGNERHRDESRYSDEITIPFAYERGAVNHYGKFDRKLLLHPDCHLSQKGGFYVVMPLHFQSYCFGYCITGNFRPAIESRFYHSFILNLDNAMETLRKQDMVKAVLARLNRKWIYDELTGVYNRAGFSKMSEELIKTAREKKESVGAIFADLDNLKKVNDTYGHEKGDVLIKSLASVMEQTMHSHEIICRYGGDEFVILFKNYAEKDIMDDIARIQTAIDNYNMLQNRPYDLSASLGYCLENDPEAIDLDAIIKEADCRMYENKRRKKEQRGQF